MAMADSESSNIRILDLETGGSRPLAGGDALFAENLFRFGDKDGKFSQILLQHPLGVLALDVNKVALLSKSGLLIVRCRSWSPIPTITK